MAEQTPLFMDINSVYSGDELGLPYRDIMGEGVVGTGDLAVTAGTGNSVNVAAGAGWVVGDTNANLQPTYRIYNDAVVNKGISPDPSNPRYVQVIAQITDQGFAGSGRNWAVVATHGTPAGSPVVPATPASALPLANILVPAAAASSAAYTITEIRPRASVGGGQAGGYATYTPAWTSTGVAPVLNNGTSVGKYVQIGKLVQGRALITLGTTTTVGTGTYSFSLPVTAAAAEPLGLAIGVATFYDSSLTQLYHMFTRLASTTTVVLDNPVQPSNVTVSATTPVVPATGDLISVKFSYEAA